MIICCRCGASHANSRKHRYCNSCQTEAVSKWKAAHPEGWKAIQVKARRKRRIRQQEIRNAAKDRPCADCGVKYPFYVMDFDHKPDTVKEFNIASGLGGKSFKKFYAEIAKCDVVCANCHRERTYSRGLSH